MNGRDFSEVSGDPRLSASHDPGRTRRRRHVLASPFVRLLIYYGIVGLVVFGLVQLYPPLQEAFSGQRLAELGQRGLLGSGEQIGVADGGRGPMESVFVSLFAIIGSLVLLAPVVWVYMVTKQREGYDESVVHTVMILPVPVTALVIVVQDSLALAFSLAGIVAAVRFRNTLKDTKDAVYIFLSIGTALAAGVQALGVAAVATVLFNYLVLVMWKYKVGNIYADQLKRAPKMRLGDVLAGAGSTPGAGTGQLTIGDPSLLQALTPDNLAEIAERKAKLREAIEGAGKGAKKYNGLLVVLANATEECLDAMEAALREHTEKFKLAEITATKDGKSTLEYLVGLQKDVSGTELMSILRSRAGQFIVAAEFRNLKIRKSKEERTPYWTLPKD